MKIAALDPASLRNIGWATMEIDDTGLKYNTGTFVAPDIEHKWQVLWYMYQFANDFFAVNKPNTVVIEQTSSFRSKKASFVGGQVSQCMGVIFAACGQNGLEDVSMVYPTSVKKIIAGTGKASKSILKKSVTNIMVKLTGEKPTFSSEHACDALANILFWLVKNEYIKIEEEQLCTSDQ